MAIRKTANDVASDLAKHDAVCSEKWKTIFTQMDDLQDSVQSMKTWLLAGLTTIIASLITIIVRGLI